MRYFIACMFLVFSSALANAEARLAISCDSVTNITIFQNILREKEADIEGQPYLYSITFDLQPEVAQKFNEIMHRSNIESIKYGDKWIDHIPIHLITSSGVITGDTPYFECVNSRQVLLSFKTKEGAFEAARKVCPQMKPKTYYVYDYLQKQRLRKNQN